MEMRMRSGLMTIATVATLAMALGCTGDMAADDTGSVGMELQIAPGVTIQTVNWSIKNPGTGFSRSASINVRFSNTVSFLAGAIPQGTGYTLAAHDTRWLVATIPLVVYGLFRYLLLLHRRGLGEEPEALLVEDLPLLATVAAWAAACGVILALT